MADGRHSTNEPLSLHRKLRLYFNQRYKQVPERDGLCHGVAGVGVDLLFSKDFFKTGYAIDKFNRLVAILKQADLNELEIKINALLEKRNTYFASRLTAYQTEATIEVKQKFNIPDSVSLKEALGIESDEKRFEIRTKLSAIINKKIADEEKKIFHQDELDLLNIFPLYDAIELYYNSHQYLELFPTKQAPIFQNIEKTFSLAQPQHLEGVARKSALKCTGIYNEEEILRYLTCIRHAAEKDELATAQFAIVLSSINHSITIGYHKGPDNPTWFLININKLPIEKIVSDKELSDIIMRSLLADTYNTHNNEKNIISFSTDIIVDNTNSIEFSKQIETQPSWMQLHQVDNEKSFKKDSWGVTWLSTATKANMIDTAEKILLRYENGKHGLKKYCDNSCLSALQLAGQYHHNEISKSIIDYKMKDSDFLLNNMESLLNYYLEKKFTFGIQSILSFFSSQNKINDIPVAVYSCGCFCQAVNKAIAATKAGDYLLREQYIDIIHACLQQGIPPVISLDIINNAKYVDIYLTQPLDLLIEEKQYELLADILSLSDLNKPHQVDDQHISIIDYLKEIKAPNECFATIQNSTPDQSSTDIPPSTIGLYGAVNHLDTNRQIIAPEAKPQQAVHTKKGSNHS